MKGKCVRPSSIEVLFTTARMIDFSFPTEDEDREENILPTPDDFEEGGTWLLL